MCGERRGGAGADGPIGPGFSLLGSTDHGSVTRVVELPFL